MEVIEPGGQRIKLRLELAILGLGRTLARLVTQIDGGIRDVGELSQHVVQLHDGLVLLGEIVPCGLRTGIGDQLEFAGISLFTAEQLNRLIPANSSWSPMPV